MRAAASKALSPEQQQQLRNVCDTYCERTGAPPPPEEAIDGEVYPHDAPESQLMRWVP